MGVALATYHRERDAAVRPGYEATCRAIEFGPLSPDERRLRAALVGNQADTDQYCGVTWETVERGVFYAPENIARITRLLGGAPA